jgi:hypothetical protein
VTTPVAKNQATEHPAAIPQAGTIADAAKAKTLTLVPPKIIGPTAPA